MGSILRLLQEGRLLGLYPSTKQLLKWGAVWLVPFFGYFEIRSNNKVSILMVVIFVGLLLFFFKPFRYIMVPSGNMGVFDPTEIHNRGQLKSHMKEAMIKLGFHLLCFFMYLYRLDLNFAA